MTSANPFRYCGEYWDGEAGTYYLRARNYAPGLGRFLTEDPVQDGLNWYVYCGNDPVMFIDPSGKIITQEEIEMFENGQMAPMAYKYMMELTYWQYITMEGRPGDLEKMIEVLQLEREFRENNYKTTGGKNVAVDEGIAYMPTVPKGIPTKEEHYFRNQLNIELTWEEFNLLRKHSPTGWEWEDGVAATLHQFKKVNGIKNRKFVSPDGYFELMYNSNNELLTQENNPYDMGTFNMSHPKADKAGHTIQDVVPYFVYGNTFEQGLPPVMKKMKEIDVRWYDRR